jgi:hypothetical protein
VGRNPVDETKSRDGNTMIWIGFAGGSLIVAPAGSAATGRVVVSDAVGADWFERFPLASPASTVYVYVPGGTFLSTNVVDAGAEPSGFWTGVISTPLR